MRRLLFPALWVAVVATISLSVWSVIRSAGGEVYGGTEETVVIEPLPQSAVTSTAATPRPKKHKRHHATKSESPSPTPSPTKAQPPSTPPKPKPTPTRPAGVTRLWSGPPGTVVSECTGTLIRLKGANPNSGWTVHVDRGSRELEVKFTRGEQEVEVHARCSGGSPVYEASRGDD